MGLWGTLIIIDTLLGYEELLLGYDYEELLLGYDFDWTYTPFYVELDYI